MREKITALIPCRNEEDNIAGCLESVLWADEVLLVDSFSTDKTLDIAQRYPVRIVQHEYINSAAQKNWAIPRVKHEWVLIVDADERVTPRLKEEIIQILENGTSYYGFRIFRLNHFMGKPVYHCGWDKDDVIRFFRRDYGRYEERQVHADMIISGGPVGVLKGKLLHYTFRSFDQYMKKFDRYTCWAAKDRDKVTGKVEWYHLTLRPLFRFIKQYILKRGFLDGKHGLIICILASFSVFLKYAKLWEIQLERKEEKTPPS